jgi:hypothetical protein
MTVLRDAIIDRIDFHIEMLEEDVQSTIKSTDNTDEDCETVAYDLKRIRNLRQLQKILREGNNPSSGSPLGYLMRDVIDEMMDLDF